MHRRSTLAPRASWDAALSPPHTLHPKIEGFSITAGNSSGLNDGAAAIVLTDDATARAGGLEPLAIVRAWASAGVAPERPGPAPTVAIPKAPRRPGLEMPRHDLWGLNAA